MGYKNGGKTYPNEGLKALAKVAPEVVERMGYEEGGEVFPVDQAMNFVQGTGPMGVPMPSGMPAQVFEEGDDEINAALNNMLAAVKPQGDAPMMNMQEAPTKDQGQDAKQLLEKTTEKFKQAARDFVEGGVSAQSAVDAFNSGQVSDVITGQAKAILASAGLEAAGLVGAKFGGIGGAAVGTAAVGAAQGALAGNRIAVNPHLAVLFEGVGFRNHSFNYKFSPRNSGESSAIKDIIFEFKNAMHPSKEGLAFFNYPDEFDISFPNNEKFLFKIGTSVLTDFQINYNPDGGSFFHVNGAPVSVSMSMSFTELDVLTKSEIGDGR